MFLSLSTNLTFPSAKIVCLSKLYSNLSADNVPILPSVRVDFPKVLNCCFDLLYIILSEVICFPSLFLATTFPTASIILLS